MYCTIRALVARNEKQINILKNALAIQLCNQTYQTAVGQMDLSTSAIAVDEIYRESANKINKTADSIILEDIDILCRSGRLTEAVGTLHHLNPADLKVRFDVYSCLLQWCVQMKSLPEGKRVHSHIIKMNFSPGIVLGNDLMNMYAKCGSLVDAQLVFDRMPLKNMCSWNTTLAGYAKSGNLEYAMELFDKMPEQDAVSWTVIIASYRQHGYYKEALHLYEQMLEAGTMPNQFTFTSVLSACTRLAVVEEGKRVHGQIVKLGLCPYVAVGNALVSLYAKCGSIEEARCMFDKMPVRNVYSWNTLIGAYTQSGDLHYARALFDKMPARDVVSWNSMISGYSQHGFDEEGIQLFVEMQQDGTKPDLFTFTSVITACANIESLKQGKKIHAHVIRTGLEMDGTVGNALVSMYAKCGNTDDAHFVFEKMPELNVVSWTAMIAGYVKCGNIEHARQLFERMPERDVVSWTAMIAGYVKCGNIEHARQLFERMPERDVVSWTSMIVGYSQHGDDKEVLQLFEEMLLSGPKPNNFTFACVLSVFASIAAIENGKQVHAYTIKVGFDSYTSVGNSLITMYAKCGNIEDACKVFKHMPEQDAVSWTAIIAGTAQHGFGKEALQLFDKMLWVGMKPDSITFLGVLMACTHAGLVDEGRHYFISMSQDHYITPKVSHYACMVDLLGRAGCLEEAEDMINKMQVEPDACVWGALLGSCRIHGNMALAKRAAEKLLMLEPENAGAYSLLANIYASFGKWDDVAKVRKMMKDRGVKKDPGCSWIEIKNKVHVFGVEDGRHPQTQEIYAMLEKLSQQIREEGYVPNMKFVLHDIEEERKEQILCHHSEKLAIAFGLINTPHGTTLRIIKNLRACGDCHNATKFISKVVGREIIVRDANRFHHFRGGSCSCGDYW